MLRRTIRHTACPFAMAGLLATGSAQAADAPATTASGEEQAGAHSLTEVNKQLTNPVSSLWSIGVLFQNWWSFGGGRRDEAASMNLQPIAAYFLANGWSIGYSGNILANWKNREGSDFTVPIGIGLSKVAKLGKLPVKIGLGVQWMAVQPDRYG